MRLLRGFNMANKNTPALPCEFSGTGGLAKREAFAEKVMLKIIDLGCYGYDYEGVEKQVAVSAVTWADALYDELDKEGGKT